VRRKGSITPFLLVSLTVLLAAFAVAVDYIFLWQTRVEMQAADDAASLAAVQSFVDDDFLTGDPAKIQPLVVNAQTAAVQYAQLNRVLARPAQLDPNRDILFGTLDHPRAAVFFPTPDLGNSNNLALATINAVRVLSPRTQARGNPVTIPLGALLLTPSVNVIAASAAMLDRDVIGFRFVNAQPLPLAPIALLSDQAAMNPLSWEYLVLTRQGPDQFRFDRQANTFVADPNGDGLHEMLVTLGQPGVNTPGTNGCILNLGPANTPAEQVRNGLTPADLQNQGGQLMLGPNNQVLLPGSPTTPSSGYADLQQSLTQLQTTAKQRIWPLYTNCDPNTGVTTLHGFVAARVVRVMAVPGGPLTFILQPTMIATPDAVTDFTRRGAGGVNITNPYVVKIRLVQ
jgi:hypothetical protein